MIQSDHMGALLGIREFVVALVLGLAFHFSMIPPPLAAAPGIDAIEESGSLGNKFHLGGRIKVTGSSTWPKGGTFYDQVGSGECLDGSGELRLTSELALSERIQAEIHYQGIWTGGDTYNRTRKLQRLFGTMLPGPFLRTHIDDERRLFDLTEVVHDSDHSILYHRLDRLNVTISEQWGTIRLGRQGITWGNGRIFNPMDMFNPFPPSAIDKEYKVGDDMLSAELALGTTGNFQLLYVPRRDPTTDDISFDHSSIATKLHVSMGTTELDLMGARHYEDMVLGLGARGYAGNAAWRADALYTFLDAGKNYLSLVANIDYSWTWFDHNVYGLVEYFHNGIGDNDYGKAIQKPEISERLDRGEMFVVGRDYLGAEIQVELHPLINVYLTLITNLHDPSGLLQPRMSWDATQDLRVIVGLTSDWGDSSSEFGGFHLDDSVFRAPSGHEFFIWALYYF